jgi:heat shock protein HslJ
MLLTAMPGTSWAQPAAELPTDYTVQAGDWLSAIATTQYGDASLYPAIVLGTKEQAASDSSYASIVDPWIIEIGWKLYVPDEASAQAGLTVTKLQNATYPSEWTKSNTAPLTGGQYSEEIVPGAASKIEISLSSRMGFGFGTDGEPLAAVILFTSSGGSGTFVDLHVVVQDNGTLVSKAVTSLGDRAQVYSLGMDGGKIVVEMLTHGPDDPMCCPTQEVRNVYVVQGNNLVEESSTGIGEADGDDSAPAEPELVDTVWQWQAYRDQAELNDIEVIEPERYTLQLLSDGTYTLKADCNNGRGEYALEGSALTLETGPMTRAACGPESQDAEFLRRLFDVATYVIEGGKLYLNLKMDAGDMVFGPSKQ